MAAAANHFCSLCIEDGAEFPAVDWCTDCCSFLCEQCRGDHKRNKASKDHQMIPAKDYLELPGFMQDIKNHCEKHAKRFEAFCIIHDCPCCAQCISDKHKSCLYLKKIPDVLLMVNSSTSISGIPNNLGNLKHNYDQILTYLDKEKASINQQKEKQIKEMKTMRQKVDLQLDKLEKQFENQLESKTQNLIEQLMASQTKVQCQKNIAQKLLKDYRNMSQNATDLQKITGLLDIDKCVQKEAEFLDEIQKSKELDKIKITTSFSSTLYPILSMQSLGDIVLHNISYSLQAKNIECTSLDSIKETLLGTNTVHVSDKPSFKAVCRPNSRAPRAKTNFGRKTDLQCTNSVVSIPYIQRISLDSIKPTLLETYNVSTQDEPSLITGCDLLPNGEIFLVDKKQQCVKSVYFENQDVVIKKLLEKERYRKEKIKEWLAEKKQEECLTEMQKQFSRLGPHGYQNETQEECLRENKLECCTERRQLYSIRRGQEYKNERHEERRTERKEKCRTEEIQSAAIGYRTRIQASSPLSRSFDQSTWLDPIICDVCCIDDKTCAVYIKYSSSSKQDHITFIKTTTKEVKHSINVESGIHCLTYKHFFFMGRDLSFFAKGEILCYTLQGEILNRFETKRIGGLFSFNSMIYYTEIKEDAVVCSDETGKIKWRCKHPIMKKPQGIVIDNRGCVFVTCPMSDYVVLIYPNGQLIKQVFSENHDIKSPSAIAIDCRNDKLMVCNQHDGKVFLFQL